MHHVSRDELRDSQTDDVHGLVDVGDDAAYLGARVPAGFGAQAQHDLVAVDRVDGSRRGSSPWRRSNRSQTGGFAKLVWAERLDTPLGHIRKATVTPTCCSPARAMTESGE